MAFGRPCARRLFGWEESRPVPVAARTAHDVAPTSAPLKARPSHGRLHLIDGEYIDDAPGIPRYDAPELDIADGDGRLHSAVPRRFAASIAGFRFA